jgi:hypothetical protein
VGVEVGFGGVVGVDEVEGVGGGGARHGLYESLGGGCALRGQMSLDDVGGCGGVLAKACAGLGVESRGIGIVAGVRGWIGGLMGPGDACRTSFMGGRVVAGGVVLFVLKIEV